MLINVEYPMSNVECTGRNPSFEIRGSTFSIRHYRISLLSRSVLAFFLICLFSLQTKAQISPGALSNAHAEFEGIRIIGYPFSPKSHTIKDFLAGNLIPYQWMDVSTDQR